MIYNASPGFSGVYIVIGYILIVNPILAARSRFGCQLCQAVVYRNEHKVATADNVCLLMDVIQMRKARVDVSQLQAEETHRNKPRG